ncbi:hypothetical protein N7462_001090 [Penicillium macrosclerotiorum]|uniref:uncharacterized protein n=1 Tax=Penicillium macrosclerotiorum TaxID=303699 RepID=UPI002546DBB0|nr:uncharacterized protein N7462_001090 [Penicillium macrosclerotiorum]KAJ5699085.1 hypothetical protein N7462_001090 [Penicillium macrosclerotiorum]
MFHAKRAHMATSKDPIWRFAIPLSPSEKSYRPTHRASGARGAVAWDMSYMSTVQLEGSESCIEAVLRAVGVNGDMAWGTRGKKWRAGTRSLQAWTFEKDHPARPIAPVTLVWCVQAKSEDIEMTDADQSSSTSKKLLRRLLIRVHPSAFLQLWNDLLESSKRQSPPVMVEDLRFEIGSIQITGPGSTEALLATLQPVLDLKESAGDSPEATWPRLIGVSNPSSLPQNALLSFNVSDPRLHFPPRTLKVPANESQMNDLAILLSTWSPDKTQGPSSLFDRPSRLAALRQLPSQKAINRRRSLSGPGNYPASKPDDPKIPVIILANRPPIRHKRNSAPGSWTVLLPWKCVTPVWYSMMYYPLSSGGNPRFGGLKEQQQLAFEAGEPWFPGDFPGTRAGWEWGQRETEKARKQWEQRPKGRRVEFDSLVLGNSHPKGEIGNGWGCEWERLVQRPPQDQRSQKDVTNDMPVDPEDKESGTIGSAIPPLNHHNIRYPSLDTNTLLTKFLKSPPDPSSIATIHLNLSSRGTPTPSARIYRLPTEPVLRKKWLDLASKRNAKSSKQKPNQEKPETPSEEARRQLAESLLSTCPSEGSGSDHLEIPKEEDLIGFVTTGNYNLSEGKSTGIGSILLSKALVPGTKLSEMRMCIVRTSGERVGRLGVWELV